MVDFSKFQFRGEDGRDEFRREPIAERIIQLLTSNIDISPMIIDGDWGTGKSEFCHKLINKFKKDKENYRIIYIDAFKADHADNPLMTIFAEIIKLVPPNKKAGFIKKALPVMRYGTKIFLKATVNHLVKDSVENIANGFDDAIQDVTNTAIDATITALLKDHEEAEKNLEALQALLAELAKDKPIIIFIDELDRCRPDFSVSMLEVIKHTFNVENVKFVLVTNTVQLKAAINHAYGSTINSNRYLDKFIKFTISLSKKFDVYQRHPQVSSVRYFDQLIMDKEELSERMALSDPDSSYIKLLHDLITHNNLTLRAVETLVRYIEIALIFDGKYIDEARELSPDNKSGYVMLYLIGVFIGCFKHNLRDSISNKLIDGDDILKLIGFGEVNSSDINNRNGVILLLASQSHKNSHVAKKIIQEYNTKGSNPFNDNFFERDYMDAEYHSSNYFRIVLDAIHTLYLISE